MCQLKFNIAFSEMLPCMDARPIKAAAPKGRLSLLKNHIFSCGYDKKSSVLLRAKNNQCGHRRFPTCNGKSLWKPSVLASIQCITIKVIIQNTLTTACHSIVFLPARKTHPLPSPGPSNTIISPVPMSTCAVYRHSHRASSSFQRYQEN